MFGLRLHGGTAILPTHGNILSKVMSTGDNFATLMTLVEVFALLSAFLSFVKKSMVIITLFIFRYYWFCHHQKIAGPLQSSYKVVTFTACRLGARQRSMLQRKSQV